MTTRNTVIAVGALCAGLLVPAQASAETAITRADLNLRVGPSTSYGVIDVIPQGYPVEVVGCVDNYAWCDVGWDGLRGWVSARYLVDPQTSAYLPQWGPSVGLPIVSFSFVVYHDRHYRDRPWHRERRWSGHWRDRDDDRRDDRREAERDDRRDDRREAERREERQEAVRREERRDTDRREAQRREERREAERLEERREELRREDRREAESRPERQLPPGQQRRIESPGQSGRALQQERGPRAEPPGRGRGRGGGGQQEDWENRGR